MFHCGRELSRYTISTPRNTKECQELPRKVLHLCPRQRSLIADECCSFNRWWIESGTPRTES
jgi:hypothetical protein